MVDGIMWTSGSAVPHYHYEQFSVRAIHVHIVYGGLCNVGRQSLAGIHILFQ